MSKKGDTLRTPEVGGREETKEVGGREDTQEVGGRDETQEVEKQKETEEQADDHKSFHQLEQQVEEQVVLENSNNNFPAIWSEEGKYLASVLGDALVKGLSLVSQRRPTDPVEYLANFLRTYKEGDEENEERVVQNDAAPPLTLIPTPNIEQVENKEGEEEEGEQPNQELEENDKKEEEEELTANDKPEAEAMEVDGMEMESQSEKDEDQKPAQSPTPKVEEVTNVVADDVATESGLNNQLNEGYDKLEDALDEEEASSAPFDPEKEEMAEKALLESSRSGDPTDEAEGAGAFPLHSSTRDDNGSSVLHFACTRPGGGSTIMAFLQNPSVNLAWRDVNLKTARDIADSLKRTENIRVIDNWVLGLANRGDVETLENLLVDGYDHLADVEDSAGVHIVDVAENAGHRDVALLLRHVPEFREKLERVHRCVRSGDVEGVKSLVGDDRRVAFSMNPKTGRNAMHVAVLCEEVAIVKWLGETVPDCVRRGDNLERTCLHYAMGVDKVEKIVRVLVRAGAKRVVKDLRDRQPSWYFINRDEIGQLQAEERAILN